MEGVVDSNHQGAEVEVQASQLLEEVHVQVAHENVEGIPAMKVHSITESVDCTSRNGPM